MRLFRYFEFRVTKQDSTGDVVGRVYDVLNSSNVPAARRLFHFDDSEYRKISACGRAVKKFPELAPFLFSMPSAPHSDSLRPVSHLSNLDPPWTEANPAGNRDELSIEVLLAVAAGIPKVYPFSHARILFDEVPWFGSPAPPSPTPSVRPGRQTTTFSHLSAAGSSVMVQSDWWTSRRDISLSACVEIEPPRENAARLADLPQSVTDILHRLGIVCRICLVIEYGPMEAQQVAERQRQADALSDRYRIHLKGVLPGDWQLPYSLPDYEVSLHTRRSNVMTGKAQAQVRFPTSPKQALIDTFHPIGYRYQASRSGRGTYSLTKRTAMNHEIEIFVGRGDAVQQFTALFSVAAPNIFASIHLPCANNINGFTSYPLIDDSTWYQALANTAVVLNRIGDQFVKEFQDAIGPAPQWFEYHS